MSLSENLARAIQALEEQRGVLGDEVVDAALEPLRARLAAAHSDTLGEQRKLVTVLFADLAGFTSLAADMDPEDVREVINAYFQRWSASIRRHAGVVEKFIGDAVLAVFGLPTAQEDDAERAVRAALEMESELRKLNEELERERGLRLSMRVGINSGEVVVSLLGERGGEEFVVVGDTVNLASRLQGAAPENGVLISADTARLVTGVFESVAFGPLDLKGVPGPVEAHLIVAARPRTFRRPGGTVETTETSLIGRRGELDQLQEALATVQDLRRPQVATIVGEAGIGKSRLLFTFEAWLEHQPDPVAVFRGRAHAGSRSAPFGLLREIFAEHARIQDSDPPAVVGRKLHDDVSSVLGGSEQAAMQAGLIARLLGFEVAGRGPARAYDEDAMALHERAVADVHEYFRAAGGSGAVVILCEDVHWADDPSLDLIESLARSLEGVALLIVCGTRPALFERRPGWSEGPPSAHTRIDLAPLADASSEELIARLLGGPVPGPVRDLVVSTAEGNPFYLEELVKMLIEDGVLLATDGGWQANEESLGASRIPPTLTGVLQARFDGLRPEERSLLQRASVIGRAFWSKAIEYLASAVPGETTVEAGPILDHLGERGMVFRHQPSTFADTDEYRFKHVLLRDVIYSTLLKRQRRLYHGLAARWVEEVSTRVQRQNEFASVIAYQYDHAQEADRAADWYVRAGVVASTQFANQEALQALTRALELQSRPDPLWKATVLLQREAVHGLLGQRDRQMTDLDDLQALVEQTSHAPLATAVALRLARLAFETGDYEGALDSARRAEALAEAEGDGESAARGALLQAGTVMRQGDLEEAARHALRASSVGAGSDLTHIEAEARRHSGLVEYYAGRPQLARDHFSHALELYQRVGDRQGEAKVINNLGGAAFAMGDADSAGVYYGRSLEMSRSIGDRVGEIRALNNLGIVAVTRGQYALAEERYLEALRLSRETRNRSHEMSALDNLGNLALYRYDYSRAERYQLDSLAGAREIGDRVTETMSLTNLTRTYLMVGDVEAARRHSRANLELAQSIEDLPGVCWAKLNLSQCDSRTGDFNGALTTGQEALELAAAGDFRSEEASAHHRVGAALAGQGRVADAAEHLGLAINAREDLGEDREAIESTGALARVLLEMGETERATERIEAVLAHLEGIGEEGFGEPERIFLNSYRVLAGIGDVRADTVIRRGRDFVEAVAARIDSAELRATYIELPERREILAVWRRQA